MKRFINLFLLVFFLAGLSELSAQYKMILQNGAQTNSKTFEFDVYIQSTGADFTLTSYQVCFTYNSAIVNGGTLTFSYIPGSTQLSIAPISTTIISDGGTSNLISGSNPGSQTVSTTPLKVGRFRLTNTNNFGIASMVVNWDFAGDFVNEVNISNRNLAAPANHINSLAPYQMILQDGIKTGDMTYEFDVYIVATTADFTLTSYQGCLNYNPAIKNSGTISYSYVASTTELTACTPIAPMVVNDGGTSNLIFGSNAGSLLVSTTPMRIGKFRITNTVPFGAATPNIAWDFAGTYQTQVNINSTNLTVQANHINYLDNSPLPVVLKSFSAKAEDNKVELNWATATELNNYGFEIERHSPSLSGYPTQEVKNWERVGFVAGAGNSNSPVEYSFTDNSLNGCGDIQYRLKQVDINGKVKYYDAVKVTIARPKEFKLAQNSPNPFNPTTSIKFQLPENVRVSIKIYDMLGREVATLVNEDKQAGSYIVYWNGRDNQNQMVASGIYLYSLQAGNFVETRKMNFMK